MVAVVLFKIKLHLLKAISTGDIFDHDVGSCLLTTKNLVEVNWTAIVIAAG